MVAIADRFKGYISEGDIWILAIRRRGEKLLFEGNNTPFSLIPNTFLYWMADPFLFEYQGQHYLFAEMFNRILGRGCIGVATIVDGNCSSFKPCLQLDCHLSYPCVFERKGIIYMLPEIAASGKVMLYKATAFPYEWKVDRQLCDVSGVDSTPLPVQLSIELQAISTLHVGKAKKNDNLYLLKANGEKPVQVLVNNRCSRPAGHFIVKDGRIIRPVQDCFEYYGKHLIFKEVTSTSLINWHEKSIYCATFPRDTSIRDNGEPINLATAGRQKFRGIHTYNLDSEYEVIDLQFNAGNTWQYFARKLLKRVKRLYW